MRFLLPYPTSPSGGHSYNRKVLEDAAGDLPWLEMVFAEPGRPVHTLVAGRSGDTDRWLLWDSLLMEDLTAAARLKTGRRHALLVHHLPSLEPLLAPSSRSALRAREDLAAGSVEAFIATGLAMGRELRLRHSGTPVFVCEPGIDPAFLAVRARRCRLHQPRCLNLLTVANLVPGKGHTRILALLRNLPKLEWRWHLVGASEVDPAFAREWLAAVRCSGLSERIEFLGPLAQDALVCCMADMDIFLSASSLESYGMALAEAVAAGLPVLTTGVGEAARLVREGVDGFVVAFGDWLRFQKLLQRLLADPTLRQRLAQAKPVEPTRTWHETRKEFAAACRAILALPMHPPSTSPG